VKAFTVVYEDDWLIVVDKAAGVLTVPTPRRERNTLVDLIGRHLSGPGRPAPGRAGRAPPRGRSDRPKAERRGRPFVVHRLDRETSGLLVFAKREEVGRALVEAWREEHERRYACIVHGRVERERGEIRSRLITGRGLQRRSSHTEEGELAVTRYEVKEQLRGATLLDVELETGRRNQIRVHMKELGHPILGDVRYAQGTPPHPAWPAGRLALHARLLVLVHPVTGARLALEAPLPPPFEKFLAATRQRA
jgi:23S rRNA pseudouridine1911/1915/1917 synthase